jgi:5-formyltetrahydrofolate cyclo-ligase
VSIISKQELRERIITLLRNQEEKKRLSKSLQIKDKLFKMQEFVRSQTILFYASFDGEVETADMIVEAQKLGKKITLPLLEKGSRIITPVLLEGETSKLTKGPYGIKQPKKKHEHVVELDEIDMIIVPGIAFDKNRNRLGRGAGYYDRLLERVSSSTPTVGIAFDFQIVDQIPHLEEHDRTVSHLIFN